MTETVPMSLGATKQAGWWTRSSHSSQSKTISRPHGSSSRMGSESASDAVTQPARHGPPWSYVVPGHLPRRR